MSGQTSHAKRAKTISRVVALSAMADDKSSVHEAAIAKKRVEKLIAAYNITERELILAGWKKPVSPSAQASNQAKPSRQSSDKKYNQKHQEQASKESKQDAYAQWCKDKEEERRRWEWGQAARREQQAHIEAQALLESRLQKIDYFSDMLSRFFLLLALPSLLVLGFEFLLIRPFTVDGTVMDFIATKPSVRRHLGFALLFGAAIVTQIYLFSLIKRKMLRVFVEKHGDNSVW